MDKLISIYETTNELDLKPAYDWIVQNNIEYSKIINSFNNLYGFNKLGGSLENVT